MKPLALLAAAILLVVALRHREPDRATARYWEPEDGIQPADPELERRRQVIERKRDELYPRRVA